MASSVFFKFKSQKEPTRVEFDGTGISVFELKREIIIKSGLGDGTDFDLHIYTDDNSEEYGDDTTIIPRSTTVIARRQPALKPGAGRAARYVSGKMPASAKNAGRREQATKATTAKPASTALSQMHNAMTEEERMAAMFNAQDEQWSAQQEELSHQTPAYKPGAKRPANVPDHEPPNGYICYRCGNKGHWIQLCPTNDDPDFDNRPRVKRTTGIPRSFLQKVDKAAIMAQAEGDDTKRPSGIMVNADGDFVVATEDKAAWERFQAKAKTTTDKEAATEDKAVAERGLECSIDKKMLIEPMKTPCCKKTFCNDCITNALIESDFVCPACETEGVLIDDLVADEEMAQKIKEYVEEKEAKPEAEPAPEVKEAEKAEQEVEKPADKDSAPEAQPEEKKAEAPKSPSASIKSPTEANAAIAAPDTEAERPSSKDSNSKKRPADEPLENNPKIPKGPKAMQNQQMNPMMNGAPMGMNSMMFNPGMGMMPPNMMGMPGMNGMNMPMGMGFPNMPMMGFPNMNMNNMNGGFGWDGGMNGMSGMNGMNGMGGMGGMGMNGGFQGNFDQQGGEDDAYFRKPVNPHRHQNKQRRVRPSDYREL